jgi:hypothetical protein
MSRPIGVSLLDHVLVGTAPDDDQPDLPDHLEVRVVAGGALLLACPQPVDDAVLAGDEPVERHGHVEDQPPLRLCVHAVTR